jgi:hypothetical protein
VPRNIAAWSRRWSWLAGLQQLCVPLLDGLEALPERQAEALRIVFRTGTGHAPGRFLVGLATLGLLAHGAERRPLVCIIDDEQWLDLVSCARNSLKI